MKLQLHQEFNNFVLAPSTGFNLHANVNNNPEDKSDTLKVKIKTQPIEAKS